MNSGSFKSVAEWIPAHISLSHLKFKQNLQSLTDGSFSPTVRYIRANPWPLIVPNTQTVLSKEVVEIAKKYTLPSCLVAEVINLIQGIGFVGESKIECDSEALQYFSNQEEANENIQSLRPSHRKLQDQDIASLDSFFGFLSQRTSVAEFLDKDLKQEDMPHGWFHIVSLYDMPFSRFKNLADFLEFLQINFEAQEHLFGAKHLTMLLTTSALPVDDIKGRETTKLSPDNFVNTIGSIEIAGESIDVQLRLAPSIAPIGFGLVVSLLLPDEQGEKSNENYCFYLSWFFEKQASLSRVQSGAIIQPIIHTIQSSTHNIGYNTEGKLCFVKEPLSTELQQKGIRLLEKEENDSPVDTKQKRDIKQNLKGHLDKIFGGLDMELELLGLLGDKFFGLGFDSFDVIAGQENLWLMQHNTQESVETMATRANARYSDKLDLLNPEKLPNGRSRIAFSSVAAYFAKHPERTQILKEIFGQVQSAKSMLTGIKNPRAGKRLSSVEIQRIAVTVRGNIMNALSIKKRFIDRDIAIESVNKAWQNFFSQNEESKGEVGSLETTLQHFPHTNDTVAKIINILKKQRYTASMGRPRRSSIKSVANSILEETPDGFSSELKILEESLEQNTPSLRQMLEEISALRL